MGQIAENGSPRHNKHLWPSNGSLFSFLSCQLWGTLSEKIMWHTSGKFDTVFAFVWLHRPCIIDSRWKKNLRVWKYDEYDSTFLMPASRMCLNMFVTKPVWVNKISRCCRNSGGARALPLPLPESSNFCQQKKSAKASLKILCSHTSQSQWICMNLYFHLFWYTQRARKEKHRSDLLQSQSNSKISKISKVVPAPTKVHHWTGLWHRQHRLNKGPPAKRWHKYLRSTRRCRAQGDFFSGSPSVLCCHSALARNLLVAPRPPRYVGHWIQSLKQRQNRNRFILGSVNRALVASKYKSVMFVPCSACSLCRECPVDSHIFQCWATHASPGDSSTPQIESQDLAIASCKNCVPVSLALHGTSISTSKGPRGSSDVIRADRCDIRVAVGIGHFPSLLGGSASQPLSFRAVAVAPQRNCKDPLCDRSLQGRGVELQFEHHMNIINVIMALINVDWFVHIPSKRLDSARCWWCCAFKGCRNRNPNTLLLALRWSHNTALKMSQSTGYANRNSAASSKNQTPFQLNGIAAKNIGK